MKGENKMITIIKYMFSYANRYNKAYKSLAK